MRKLGVIGLAAVIVLTAAGAGHACPFCGPGSETLTQKASKAAMVLSGKLTSSNEDKDTTEFAVEEVIVDHEKRDKSKKTLTLGRYIDLSFTSDKDRFVVFCDFYKGKIDAYQGMAIKKGSKLPEYLRGALKVKDKPNAERLRYFFDHLDDKDLEVSSDAYWEFANAGYNDYAPLAKNLPAERIVKWLEDAETPSNRLGLYASMLGHCGKKADAAVLKKILDDKDRRTGSGIDGVMAGYVLLEPKKGFDHVKAALKDTQEDFTYRYAVLKTVRFFHEYRPDVITKADLLDAACILLPQDDIGDLAIEDLRKWQAWDRLDAVLAVKQTAAYKVPIVRRAVLRFCLQCPDKKAAEHVAERKKADATEVERAEQLLAIESETLKKAAEKKK